MVSWGGSREELGSTPWVRCTVYVRWDSKEGVNPYGREREGVGSCWE